jgi:hypothetical protein
VTPQSAAPAASTGPACGVGTPAGACFCPACGQRLLGGVDLRLAGACLAGGDLDEAADAAATQALDQATIMGAGALVRRLHAEVGR